MLDYILAYSKREEKLIFKEIIGCFEKYGVKFVANITSRFESYFFPKNLPSKRRIVDRLHAGKSNISMNIFLERFSVRSDKDLNSIYKEHLSVYYLIAV